MKEVWKSIRGYEDSYQISSQGRVKSLSRKDSIGRVVHERILKSAIDSHGYSCVSLCKDSRMRTFATHILITQAFICNPSNKAEVNHKDGIKTNNDIDNLEWVTHQENIRHAVDTGLKDDKGEKQVNSKLTNKDIVRIRNSSLSQVELARDFEIDPSHISKIKSNQRWGHIR